MRLVKYPFSDLKKHHSTYIPLLYDFFDITYNSPIVKIYETNETLVINIFNVDENPIYNPCNFDGAYRVYDNNYDFKFYISEYSLLDDLFRYIPDLCPYLDFVLHSNRIGVFRHFNLREGYYNMYNRHNYSNSGNFII